MHFVHLEFAEAQKEVGSATVASAAFGATGKAPRLFAVPARNFPIFYSKLLLVTFRRDERCVGLALVPTIGIPGPLPSLHQKNPGFYPPARRAIAGFEFEGKSLNKHSAIGRVP